MIDVLDSCFASVAVMCHLLGPGSLVEPESAQASATDDIALSNEPRDEVAAFGAISPSTLGGPARFTARAGRP